MRSRPPPSVRCAPPASRPRAQTAAGLRALSSACALLACACNVVSHVGSTCDGGHCTATTACEHAEQQLGEDCDPKTRVCNRVALPPDQAACEDCNATLDRLRVESALASCACVYCAAQVRACFASEREGELNGDGKRDTLCQAAVECGWANGCAGSDCYCGAGVTRNRCLLEANDPDAGARGPCAGVIEAVAGCTDAGMPGDCVFAKQLETGSVLWRATELAKCVTGDPLIQGNTIEPKCPLDQIGALGAAETTP